MYTPRPKVIGHLVPEKIHVYEGVFPISYIHVAVIFIVATTIFVPPTNGVSEWNLILIGLVFSEKSKRLSNEQPWLKDQSWPLVLIYSHNLIKLNIHVSS